MEQERGGQGLLVRGWKWPASPFVVVQFRFYGPAASSGFLHFVTAQKDASSLPFATCVRGREGESSSGPQSTPNLPFKASLK